MTIDADASPRVVATEGSRSLGPSAVLGLLLILAAILVCLLNRAPTDSVAGPALAFALSLVILIRTRKDEDGDAVVLAWAVRLLVAFVAYRLFIMANTTQGDWIRYDQLGWVTALDIRSGAAMSGFSFNGSADNVTTFVGRLYALLGRSPTMVVVLESALGLLASLMYLAACRLLVRRPPAAVRYGLLFFPSFVFWTTMIGKDPFVALGLALGVYGAVAMCVGRGWPLANVAMMAAGVCLCLLFRPYLCLIQVPALLAAMILALFGRPAAKTHLRARTTGSTRRAVAVTALILGILVMPVVLRAGMQKLRVRSLDVSDLVGAAGLQRTSCAWTGGSNTGFTGYGSTVDILKKLPSSLGTLLLRPFPWEAHNGAAAVAAVDTTLFTGLWAWVLVNLIRRRGRGEMRPAHARMGVRFLLIWTVLWITMFMNMTANLGTMVRHRVQIVPVVLLLAAVFASRVGAQPKGGEA